MINMLEYDSWLLEVCLNILAVLTSATVKTKLFAYYIHIMLINL